MTKRLMSIALVLMFSCLTAFAQTIEAPTVKGKTSFAVIVDNHTSDIHRICRLGEP